VKVFEGFGGIRLPQANNAATEHTLRASLHFKKVPHENRILSAEPAGWWHLTAIGSISKSDTKKENSHALKKCCESF